MSCLSFPAPYKVQSGLGKSERATYHILHRLPHASHQCNRSPWCLYFQLTAPRQSPICASRTVAIASFILIYTSSGALPNQRTKQHFLPTRTPWPAVFVAGILPPRIKWFNDPTLYLPQRFTPGTAASPHIQRGGKYHGRFTFSCRWRSSPHPSRLVIIWQCTGPFDRRITHRSP